MRSERPLLVDTSVLIDHLRGRSEASGVLRTAREHGRRVCGSVVTRTEILGGMRSDERSRTYALLDVIEWIPIDIDISDRAGELARTFHRAFPGVDVADFLIAATAELLGAELVTRNVKHFPMVGGLASPY